jgi:adhesin transport system membrane fusion protein
MKKKLNKTTKKIVKIKPVTKKIYSKKIVGNKKVISKKVLQRKITVKPPKAPLKNSGNMIKPRSDKNQSVQSVMPPESKKAIPHIETVALQTNLKKRKPGFISVAGSFFIALKNGLVNLIKFLGFLAHFFWLSSKASLRVLKVLYVIGQFFIINIWKILKILVPYLLKRIHQFASFLVHKASEYSPVVWNFLKNKLPLYWAWLEKNLPIFLRYVEVKAIDFWKFTIAKAHQAEVKIRTLISFLKKEYPFYKKKALIYFGHLRVSYKKHRPYFYQYIKEYFVIKERPDEHENLRDFVTDADHYILHQEPIRGMLIIRIALVTLFVVFLWAALTQVNELVKGDGKVVPSSQLQILQSLDGGIVQGIFVKEGDAVKAGQVLVKIDTTRFLSSVRENDAQRTALSARAERINALLENRKFSYPDPATPEVKEAYSQEERYFNNAKIQLDSQVSAASDQLASSQRELRLTRPLLSSGAVSEVEIIRLEREVTRLKGLREQTESEFKNNLRKDLSDTMAKFNSLSEGSVGLEDRVKQSEIKSPLDGYVKRLLVNTVGGVIGPAKDIIEVVPSEDNLVIEAKVQPRDIAFLRVGQKALIKLTAYDFSIYGGMEGALDSIGADSIVDEKGNAYFVVKVKTSKLKLKKDLPIIPGMQAEVDIETGSKSILTYLLKPILRAKQIAFTER